MLLDVLKWDNSTNLRTGDNTPKRDSRGSKAASLHSRLSLSSSRTESASSLIENKPTSPNSITMQRSSSVRGFQERRKLRYTPNLTTTSLWLVNDSTSNLTPEQENPIEKKKGSVPKELDEKVKSKRSTTPKPTSDETKAKSPSQLRRKALSKSPTIKPSGESPTQKSPIGVDNNRSKEKRRSSTKKSTRMATTEAPEVQGRSTGESSSETKDNQSTRGAKGPLGEHDHASVNEAVSDNPQRTRSKRFVKDLPPPPPLSSPASNRDKLSRRQLQENLKAFRSPGRYANRKKTLRIDNSIFNTRVPTKAGVDGIRRPSLGKSRFDSKTELQETKLEKRSKSIDSLLSLSSSRETRSIREHKMERKNQQRSSRSLKKKIKPRKNRSEGSNVEAAALKDALSRSSSSMNGEILDLFDRLPEVSCNEKDDTPLNERESLLTDLNELHESFQAAKNKNASNEKAAKINNPLTTSESGSRSKRKSRKVDNVSTEPHDSAQRIESKRSAMRRKADSAKDLRRIPRRRSIGTIPRHKSLDSISVLKEEADYPKDAESSGKHSFELSTSTKRSKIRDREARGQNSQLSEGKSLPRAQRRMSLDSAIITRQDRQRIKVAVTMSDDCFNEGNESKMCEIEDFRAKNRNIRPKRQPKSLVRPERLTRWQINQLAKHRVTPAVSPYSRRLDEDSDEEGPSLPPALRIDLCSKKRTKQSFGKKANLVLEECFVLALKDGYEQNEATMSMY